MIILYYNYRKLINIDKEEVPVKFNDRKDYGEIIKISPRKTIHLDEKNYQIAIKNLILSRLEESQIDCIIMMEKS